MTPDNNGTCLNRATVLMLKALALQDPSLEMLLSLHIIERSFPEVGIEQRNEAIRSFRSDITNASQRAQALNRAAARFSPLDLVVEPLTNEARIVWTILRCCRGQLPSTVTLRKIFGQTRSQ